MQHGIRETVQMAPGRVGPVFPQAPMPGPSAPAAYHVVPEPDSGVAAPPQVPDHADRPTDPDIACVAAVAAANLAVEGVEDVTRYGLTIPFTRWLFAYKAGLAAEDFAISTKEDLELAERERAAETTSAAPGVPTDGNRDSTAPATPSDETPSDDTGKDEAEDAVPDAQGNEGETDATPEPKLVVAVGDCGCTGGLFGESYASCGRIANVIPVDVSIPGCPPTPQQLIQGILAAIAPDQQTGTL